MMERGEFGPGGEKQGNLTWVSAGKLGNFWAQAKGNLGPKIGQEKEGRYLKKNKWLFCLFSLKVQYFTQ